MATLQCKYLINGKRQCKLSTKTPDAEFCHIHKALSDFKFPRPDECPVCFKSIHQCIRPLECGHWIHRSCVKKSGKAECPVCRHELTDIKVAEDADDVDFETELENFLEELFLNSEIENIEIPDYALLTAVITFQVYAYILNPENRDLGLDHFVDAVMADFISSDHPDYQRIFSILYSEALQIFFDPQNWNN